MRRRRLLLFLLAGAVVVTVVWLAWLREREPEYNGRPLSQWTIIYAEPPLGLFNPREQAEIAFRSIGTNALPWLVKWARPHPWKKRLAALTRRLPRRFWFLDDSPGRANAAWLWLYRLGPEARPALPDLERLMHDTQNAQTALNAIHLVSQMDKDAVPPLVSLLDNPRASNRVAAAAALPHVGDMGTNAPPAVRALIRCLTDPAPDLAAKAAWALGQLALEPGLSVPALAQATRNPDAVVRYEAAMAILRFGDADRYVTPSLLEALNDFGDPDSALSSNASNVLRYLAPQWLPK